MDNVLNGIDKLSDLKVILREKDFPYFEDDELMLYLKNNNEDLTKTAYQCLILKSESTNLVSSGLEVADTSKYFRRIAQRYKANNSGVLKGE